MHSTPPPQKSFWQIWNMSFGFLGIQFGWGLQMANMSAIYEFLGAEAHQIPMLWLAAPLTGLIVQPLIGHMSDRTWTRLGRRRPYFLVGALLSSAALIAMPNASSLWMAAGLLWILDASINISMEPFRAFVADVLPPEQRTRGFTMQSVLIGLGAIAASALPWFMSHVLGVSGGGEGVPAAVRYAFYVGAVAFLGAVLWTIVTTGERPPEVIMTERARVPFARRAAAFGAELREAVVDMPSVMRQLAGVQVFTWLGLFCMWMYFPVAVARGVFGAPDESSPLYRDGIAWAGMCFAAYSVVTFFYAMFLPRLAQRLGQKATHALSLCAGAAGLISIAFISTPSLLLVSMVGVGIAWASILAMPYAMLANAVPAHRMGLTMGIFNFFIVIPEICAAIGLGPAMRWLLGDNRMAAVTLGGVCLLVAAALTLRVRLAASGRVENDIENDAEDGSVQSAAIESPAQGAMCVTNTQASLAT